MIDDDRLMGKNRTPMKIREIKTVAKPEEDPTISKMETVQERAPWQNNEQLQGHNNE
jgi:hypothetical protein